MKTIILPGYSSSNKDWAYEVKEKLNLNHEVVVHEWNHWSSGNMSVKHETESITKAVGSDEVNIIAKSVGTRIVMHLVPKIGKHINKLILCGIPTKFVSEIPRKLYSEGLSLLSPSQVVVMQNNKDPFASFEIINMFIKSINKNIKVIEKNSNDHNYPYFEDFQKLLTS